QRTTRIVDQRWLVPERHSGFLTVPAQEIESLRPGQQQQPDEGRRANGLVAVGTPPRLPKRLLEHVLGVPERAEQLAEHAQHARRVAVVKLGEGGLIPSRDVAHELLIRSLHDASLNNRSRRASGREPGPAPARLTGRPPWSEQAFSAAARRRERASGSFPTLTQVAEF